MSVIQTNTWTCDICGATETTGGVTMPWVDPVVSPPRDWTADLEVPFSVRSHATDYSCEACPKCAADPNWDKYVERQSMPKYPESIINNLGRLPRAGDWFMPCCLEDLELITAEDLPGMPELISEGGGDVFSSLDAALAVAVPDLQRSGHHTQNQIDQLVSHCREIERKFAAGEDITHTMNESSRNPYADGANAFVAGQPRPKPPEYE